MRLPATQEEFFEMLGLLEQEIQQGQAEVALETLDLITREPGAEVFTGFCQAIRGKALHALRRLAEASDAYERALAGLTMRDALPVVASTLNNLGIALWDRGHAGAAQERFEEALRVYRGLAVDSPNLFNPYLGMVLNNLGNALNVRGQTAQAQEVYGESLKFRMALAAESPQKYKPDLAMTLNNLGNALMDRGQIVEAQKHYERALTIYEEWTTNHGPEFNPYLAMSLNNLGMALRGRGRMAEAIQMFERALAIRESLAASNPKDFNSDLASTLNNLGIAFAYQGQAAEAEVRLRKALALYQSLATMDPGASEPDVAMTLLNLGNALRGQGRHAEAKRCFKEALVLFRQFARAEPRAFKPRVAMTLLGLANVLSDQGLCLHQRAQQVDSRSNESIPEPWSERVRECLTRANEIYGQALRAFLNLAEEDPRAFSLNVAKTLYSQGRLLNRVGKHFQAEQVERAAAKAALGVLATVHSLTEQEESLTRLVGARTEAAYALACLGRPGEAWAESRMARTAFRTLLTDDPEVRDLKLEVERLDQRIKLKLTDVRALERLLQSWGEETEFGGRTGTAARQAAEADLQSANESGQKMVAARKGLENRLVQMVEANFQARDGVARVLDLREQRRPMGTAAHNRRQGGVT